MAENPGPLPVGQDTRDLTVPEVFILIPALLLLVCALLFILYTSSA